MNKRRCQPLRRRPKAQSNNSERRPDSERTLTRIVVPGALLTLGVAITIGFGASFLFKLRGKPSTNSANTQVVVATPPSPTPVEKGGQTNPVSDNLDGARSETMVAEDSTSHPSPVPTPVSEAPLTQPTAMASDTKARDAKPSEIERKSIERERRKAERKRSRLEAMHQKHEISDEAYKKGQDEYKDEMAKYRSVMDGAGAANE
jgi:hypothetical protein